MTAAKDYYKGGFRVMRDGAPMKVFLKMKGDQAVRAKDWVPPVYEAGTPR